MSLEKLLAGWDGKSAAYMADVYSGYAHESTFVVQLVELCGQPSLQTSATWFIKRHLEQGERIAPTEVTQIYQQLPTLAHWEAKLHILQCLPYWSIPTDSQECVEDFVRGCLTDQNKFVRAWAYGGFYELATQFPEYRDEATRLLDKALEEEAASVKARIRTVLKQAKF